MSLAEVIATPDRKRTYVRRLFATIADRYDLITVLLSYGQDRRWKRRLVAMASARAGSRAVDLAMSSAMVFLGDPSLRGEVQLLEVLARLRQEHRHVLGGIHQDFR